MKTSTRSARPSAIVGRLRGLQERLERLERERSEHEQARPRHRRSVTELSTLTPAHRPNTAWPRNRCRWPHRRPWNRHARTKRLLGRNWAAIREQIGQFESRLHVFEQLEAAFEGFQKGAQAILETRIEGIPGTEVLRGTLATQLPGRCGRFQLGDRSRPRKCAPNHPHRPPLHRTHPLHPARSATKKGRYPLPDPRLRPWTPPPSTPDRPLGRGRCPAVSVSVPPSSSATQSQPLRSLVDALLSHVWVANDLDTALLAHAEGCRATIVTQTGESITACGLD